MGEIFSRNKQLEPELNTECKTELTTNQVAIFKKKRNTGFSFFWGGAGCVWVGFSRETSRWVCEFAGEKCWI
jgi:hypothetical protein